MRLSIRYKIKCNVEENLCLLKQLYFAPVKPRLMEMQDSTLRQVIVDPQFWIDRYKTEIENGETEINSDSAKLLFNEYDIDPMANVQGVHEASAMIAQLLLETKLRDLPKGSHVLLSAGGGASGKTYAIDNVLKPEPGFKADLIYDSVMKTADGNERIIQKIINAGHSPQVVAVFTPIEVASQQNIIRTIKHRRLVPLQVLAKGHYGFQQAFANSTYDFCVANGVEVRILENDGKTKPVEIEFEKFKELIYNEIEAVKQLADKYGNEEYENNPDNRDYDTRIPAAYQGQSLAQNDTRRKGEIRGEQRRDSRSDGQRNRESEQGTQQLNTPQTSDESASESLDYGTLENPNTGNLAKAFAQRFNAGHAFAGIVEARKFAANLLGEKIETGSVITKKIDEAIEVGVVLVARKIVELGRAFKNSPNEIYASLVSLYERQPNLSSRTSTSVSEQAYSTPAPLAFVASELAGINENTTVYEPSAGNGMLLIKANPQKTSANELNPDRANNLHTVMSGVGVTNEDASRAAFAQNVDVVIANPPFGTVKDADEVTKTFQINDRYSTNELDHAIVFKSLEAMKDEGSAVLIVGGIQGTDDVRSDKYNKGAKRKFYYSLYNEYNVVDHFTIDGKMYSRQGAAYPVDVIVIRGRGQSNLELPAASVPRTIENYEDLGKVLNGKYATDLLDSKADGNLYNAGQSDISTPDGSKSTVQLPDGQTNVSDAAGGQNTGDGQQSGKPDRSGRGTSRANGRRKSRVSSPGSEGRSKFDSEQSDVLDAPDLNRTDDETGKQPGSGDDLQGNGLDVVDRSDDGERSDGKGVTTTT